MTVLRRRIEGGDTSVDTDDWGGCGCLPDPEITAPPPDQTQTFQLQEAPDQMPGALPYLAPDPAGYAPALDGDGFAWLRRVLPPPAPQGCPRCGQPMRLPAIALLWQCSRCDIRQEEAA
ncbi:hypothetical protein ACFQZC_25410 [Streptacidiphilus monticola]